MTYSENTNCVFQFYEYLADRGAEWNYTIGVPLNCVTALLDLIPKPAETGIVLGWNYLDAVYTLYLAGLQLTSKDKYKQSQNSLKGLLNLFSGIQLFILSYNPFLTGFLGVSSTAFASPAFALAMGIDLINASIDFYDSCKELSVSGWIEEKAKELAFYRRMDIEDSEIQRIEENIFMRIRSSKDKSPLITILKTYDPLSYQLDRQRDTKLSLPANENDIRQDMEIQMNLNAVYEKNLETIILKSLSFIGMTLLAVSSFMATGPILYIGLAITLQVAIGYTKKNIGEIIKSLPKLAFFSPPSIEGILNTDKAIQTAISL
jgi:hypothetical protein